MTDIPLVVLDACVLANFSLCDTLLRLAEPPRLYEPKWSEEIIRETTRTLEGKLGWPRSLTARIEAELRAHFNEAWIVHDGQCKVTPYLGGHPRLQPMVIGLYTTIVCNAERCLVADSFVPRF